MMERSRAEAGRLRTGSVTAVSSMTTPTFGEEALTAIRRDPSIDERDLREIAISSAQRDKSTSMGFPPLSRA